jgi:hypothetical protein
LFSAPTERQAADWWDAYSIACPNRNNITWQEFGDNFRTYHIPSGVIKLKQKKFLALKQGNMSVTEYLDKFTHLSWYAPDEVNTDPKRQERFLNVFIRPLNYQLQSHTFANFQMLLNKAIGLENKRMELGEQKCKFKSHGQSSNTRPRFNSFQNSQFYSGGSSGNYTLNLQLQHSTQQLQHSSQQIPHAPSHHQDRSEAPVRSNSRFVLMVVSIVENWDIMPTFVRSATCRLLRKILVRDLDSRYHKLVLGILLIEVTKVNGTMHVEE